MDPVLPQASRADCPQQVLWEDFHFIPVPAYQSEGADYVFLKHFTEVW